MFYITVQGDDDNFHEFYVNDSKSDEVISFLRSAQVNSHLETMKKLQTTGPEDEFQTLVEKFSR